MYKIIFVFYFSENNPIKPLEFCITKHNIMYSVSYDNYIANFYVIMGNLRMHASQLYNLVRNLCSDLFTKNMILHKYSQSSNSICVLLCSSQFFLKKRVLLVLTGKFAEIIDTFQYVVQQPSYSFFTKLEVHRLVYDDENSSKNTTAVGAYRQVVSVHVNIRKNSDCEDVHRCQYPYFVYKVGTV